MTIPTWEQWCRSVGHDPVRHARNAVLLSHYRNTVNHQRGLA